MHKKSHAPHHAKAPHPGEDAAREPLAGSGTGEAGAEAPAPEASAGVAAGASVPEAAVAAAEAAPAAVAEAPAPPASDEGSARLESEVADLKDRLLRTAADFDNFRKRAAKEKSDTWGRAQGDLIVKILDGLDDLGRVAHLDPAQTSAESLHEGVGLVERKFLKALEGVGLERLDPSGQVFDPNAHEAVMTTPAPAADRDGHVSMVFQAGYRLNGVLLRPARVAVFAFTEPPPGGDVVN